MRSWVAIVSLVVLGACASRPHQKLIVDQQSDLFKQESLWRVASTQQAEGHLLKECYQGNLSQFTQKARAEYEKGAKTTQYWIWVGNCLAWHDELKEARFFLGMAQELAKSKEEQAMVKNNLGLVYLRLGRVSLAYESFKEAHKLAPQFVSPAFNLAQLYIEQNLNQEGLKILNQGVFEKSQNVEVLHLKGLAHLQLKNIQGAGEYLSKISSQYHGREDFALTLAQWHLHSGRPQEALNLIKSHQSTGLPVPAKLSERLRREAQRQIAAVEKK